ncbi:helix-turn-helix transcriptional regulator [bacterium]|nr:helix-turn-helix transcriptional regulator [bacterium]
MVESGKIFGERLKEIRKNNRMSQSKLAELLNVDEKYISRLETGSSTPSFSMLVKISQVLNISLETLFKFKHFRSRDELVKIIISKIQNATEEKVQLIYKIVEDILE